MNKEKGKIIVITGATKGLGLAMAEELIEAGHTVVACGRKASAIRRLSKLYPEPHSFSVVDISSDEEVKAWAKETLSKYGTPDILINNAGVINESAPLWEVKVKDFDQVIDVNIKGVANTIRHFVPSMVDKTSGIIVNFSSTWGRSVSAEVAPYCASKWGVEGLTKALSEELPTGMAAVALNPGIINTEMLQTVFGEAAESYIDPTDWAKQSVPLILKLKASHNGKSLSV